MTLLALAAQGCIWVEADDEARLYERCDSSFECASPADGCIDIVVDYGDAVVADGMCTNGCFDDFDCFRGGVCLNLDGANLCYGTCNDDFDCDIGFICAEAEGEGFLGAVCLPG